MGVVNTIKIWRIRIVELSIEELAPKRVCEEFRTGVKNLVSNFHNLIIDNDTFITVCIALV